MTDKSEVPIDSSTVGRRRPRAEWTETLARNDRSTNSRSREAKLQKLGPTDKKLPFTRHDACVATAARQRPDRRLICGVDRPSNADYCSPSVRGDDARYVECVAEYQGRG